MNPLFLETSRPGDLRRRRHPQRVSQSAPPAAIGEGSMAVRLVFDRLQSAGIADAISSSAPAHLALRPKF